MFFSKAEKRTQSAPASPNEVQTRKPYFCSARVISSLILLDVFRRGSTTHPRIRRNFPDSIAVSLAVAGLHRHGPAVPKGSNRGVAFVERCSRG